MIPLEDAVIARHRIGAQQFEVLVASEQAIAYKHGKDIPIEDILADRKIFLDARKGLEASENKVHELFGSKDMLDVARTIIKKGEVQITTEHMQKLREARRKQVLSMIHANSFDPKTNLPHPMTRLASAMQEIKYNIDPFKPAEAQMRGIVHLLKPVLPIKIGSSEFEIVVPHHYVGAAQNVVRKYAAPAKERFDASGNWQMTISIPTGISEEFFEKLNALTHGELIAKKRA